MSFMLSCWLTLASSGRATSIGNLACCLTRSAPAVLFMQQGTAHPQQNGKWRMAEQFGATCALTLDDAVTHVVAVALGTDKVAGGLPCGGYYNAFAITDFWLQLCPLSIALTNRKSRLVIFGL